MKRTTLDIFRSQINLHGEVYLDKELTRMFILLLESDARLLAAEIKFSEQIRGMVKELVEPRGGAERHTPHGTGEEA